MRFFLPRSHCHFSTDVASLLASGAKKQSLYSGNQARPPPNTSAREGRVRAQCCGVSTLMEEAARCLFLGATLAGTVRGDKVSLCERVPVRSRGHLSRRQKQHRHQREMLLPTVPAAGIHGGHAPSAVGSVERCGCCGLAPPDPAPRGPPRLTLG